MSAWPRLPDDARERRVRRQATSAGSDGASRTEPTSACQGFARSPRGSGTTCRARWSAGPQAGLSNNGDRPGADRVRHGEPRPQNGEARPEPTDRPLVRHAGARVVVAMKAAAAVAVEKAGDRGAEAAAPFVPRPIPWLAVLLRNPFAADVAVAADARMLAPLPQAAIGGGDGPDRAPSP